MYRQMCVVIIDGQSKSVCVHVHKK